MKDALFGSDEDRRAAGLVRVMLSVNNVRAVQVITSQSKTTVEGQHASRTGWGYDKLTALAVSFCTALHQDRCFIYRGWAMGLEYNRNAMIFKVIF
ncbi:hypothetical protein RRG08_047935 [Elysia crispata]|uniref:Uncharacterized protein n=1 Tax=Elysia crispata TaxID=231223 RepID=A0AAE0ZLM3_9GAST|nr:hypothetical protein RRG08_047935 [Elysia crispata]